MEGSSWALVIAAFITAAFGLAQTIVAQRKLTRIENSGQRVEERTTKIDDKAEEVHHQVRGSNGRTLAQTVEDNTNEIAQLRGDVIKLAVQFARHTSDPHTHEFILRKRQERRDRQEMGHNVREFIKDDEFYDDNPRN